MVVEEMKQGRQQRLLVLIALVTFVVFLSFVFVAQPVYADSGSNSFWPGEPGGGSEHTIEGYVYNRATGNPAAGVTVYLYFGGWLRAVTMTDANGHFIFQGSYINPYIGWDYIVTINGEDSYLGYYLDDYHWGQWKGIVQTDDIGYGYRYIYLEPAAVVNVPATALYSNTAYTQQIAYSTGSSHDLNFKSSVGSTGFLASQSWTQGFTWTIYGQHTAQFGRRYYAVGYYDDSSGSIFSTGLSAPFDENEPFATIDVPEYLTPDLSKPNYGLPTDATPFSFVIGGSESVSFQYMETGSFTWSFGYSGNVGISFLFFSASVKIDVTGTVTSGHTNAVTLTVGPLPAGTPHHKFVVYTRGFSFTMPSNNPYDPNNKGGLELHIWDAGVTT